MDCIPRKEDLAWLLRWKDRDVIKVISGVRRCGKSTLLSQFKNVLLDQGVPEVRIIELNFENIAYENLCDYRSLHGYIQSRAVDGQTVYVLLDEIQNVCEFERAIDSLYAQKGFDLYITGSNASLLSGELATLLSGRYVEREMTPLSFAEYFEGKGGSDEAAGDVTAVFDLFMRQGGFPYMLALSGEEKNQREYLQDLYRSTLLKDVVERSRIAEVRVLESISQFLAASVGSIVSTRSIANTLASKGRKADSKTVEKYLRGLTNGLLFYEVPRWDVRGKELLARLSKYYIVDTGLRTQLVRDASADIGHVLENVVYLELRRRFEAVYVGRIDGAEIDFVAKSGQALAYFQVAASVLDPSALARELGPLKAVNDNYPKTLITLDAFPRRASYDGIEQVYAPDWLLRTS